MKKIILLITSGILFLIGAWLIFGKIQILVAQNRLVENEESVLENDKVIATNDTPQAKPVLPVGLNTETFVGKLEEVNTGCFADGECYVVVDGKHVTTLIGRRPDMVGSIIGVDGFGELENFIGEEVEVLATVDSAGGYTLYGDENLYVKLTKSGGTTTQINGLAEILGVSINPKSILEDSRCPIDVNCIQAGTVRIEALVDSGSGAVPYSFTLGQSIKTDFGEMLLYRVEPNHDTTTDLAATDYVFYFKVKIIN